jgi:hypothetical protein
MKNNFRHQGGCYNCVFRIKDFSDDYAPVYYCGLDGEVTTKTLDWFNMDMTDEQYESMYAALTTHHVYAHTTCDDYKKMEIKNGSNTN